MTPWLMNGLLITGLLWGAALLGTLLSLRFKENRPLRLIAGFGLYGGVLVMGALIIVLWVMLGRPPMRTLGETRLWYAFLLPLIGVILEIRLKTVVLRLPMLFFGLLFLAINLMKPDGLDRTLMPALQSPWFVPHVVVYMIAYSALGLSCGAALWNLVRCWFEKKVISPKEVYLPQLLMRLGLPFLTLGLVFGALWAREAWGHYWTWDPKETWAFITWAAYVAVLHLEERYLLSPKRHLILLSSAFLLVLGCWFLMNSLPAAQTSVHSYSS